MGEKEAQRLCVLSRFPGSILLAAWTTHPSYGGLHMPCLDVRCPLSCQEAAGVTKCHRTATDAHSHVCNRQIHEDLDVPFFRQNIIELTEKFGSKFSPMWDTVSRKFGRYLCCLRAEQSRLSP